ncbi:MAG: amidohydrolase [Desulfomonile sp.]|nr:amidohydrolase [Desulfomonile sp.]
MSGSIVLSGGLILANPMHPAVVPHDITVVSGERLAAVNVPSEFHPLGARVIDCTGCLIMPGLVNGHIHAAMSLLRGLADDLPLDRWLNEYMFPAEARHAGPEFVYLGTKLSAIEMALNGVTTYADGYFHMEHAAAAAIEVGLRAVVAQGVLDVPTPDAPEAGSWETRVEAFLSAFPSDSLVSPALFCHSAYLCGPESLRRTQEICRKGGMLLFTHVAETAQEVQEIRARHNEGPVEHLREIGLLGRDLVAVHAVHVTREDIDVLAESGTGVIHCPESNMKLASGAAPVAQMLSLGIPVGIGTDGPASNNNLDLFEEMRSASLMAKLVTGDPEALDAATVLRMATIDGARILGMDHEIGSLEPGKLADVIVVDLKRPHLTPLYDPVSHLVYAARGSDVRHVVVNGVQIVENGRITTVDEEEAMSSVAAMAREIGETSGEPRRR